MKLRVHTISALLVGVAVLSAIPALPQSEKKSGPSSGTPTQGPKNQTAEMGKSYALLLPEQKRLVDAYVSRYNATTGDRYVPEAAFDGARLSLRTTFDAVTHALVNAKMSDTNGKSLGRAIDLVDAIDDIMGEENGVGGDRQFRLYVYLKPNTIEKLAKSREFQRERDNSVYHKGFPTCYRLKNGPPSIQFSISRDARMADIDVDYRSSGFPAALFNGHLTASNSDVRAGTNLQKHDGRWAGLNGWWREVFGLLDTSSKKIPKETATAGADKIPLNPAVKASDGIDKSAHDFLHAWIVDKHPENSVAYISRRSYPCLESIARSGGKPIPPGMVRLRTKLAMQKFSDGAGDVTSVTDVFEPPDQWALGLKDASNSFPTEYRLVSVPAAIGQNRSCVEASADESEKASKETYYATAFRTKRGGKQGNVTSLLWAQEGDYWKIIAIRIEDGGEARIVPRKSEEIPAESAPKSIVGDPAAVKDVTAFYSVWLVKRDAAQASHFASPRSYSCLSAPEAADKGLTPAARIHSGLERLLNQVPANNSLSAMMSAVQPVNEFIRPVDQENSAAFALMAVPDQMANSFLCQNRQRPDTTQGLALQDAKYGAYYLSASRFKLEDSESAALLLLWTKEKTGWRIVAWAVDVP